MQADRACEVCGRAPTNTATTLLRVINAKLKGTRPKLEARETPERAGVVDLMSRLRASLESKGAAGRKTAKRTARGPSRGHGRSRKGRAA